MTPRPQSHVPRPSPAPFQKALLGWYDHHRRDLPWRQTHDPYAIFVSEMMLQQTQVKTVLPYYDRWMIAYPSWRALDAAPLEQVLKMWEGLGYYRRARHLKAAAHEVVTRHHGRLPSDRDALLTLPGVGPYSVGALRSIAFGAREPLVDGNVIRVFARTFALPGDLKNGVGHKTLWGIATHLVPKERPGDHNQALMELGATICLPSHPLCEECPLLKRCRAAQEGDPERYPTPPPKERTQTVHMATAFIEKGGKLLLRRRPENARWWQGLWELPSIEGKDPEEARRRLEKETGRVLDDREVARARHQVTHHRIECRCYRTLGPPRQPRRGIVWVDPFDARTPVPLPSFQTKLLRIWRDIHRKVDRTGKK